MKQYLLFLILITSPFHLFSQKIYTTFHNPSFETVGKHSIKGWTNQSVSKPRHRSYVSIHSPKEKTSFGVTQLPKDGERYVSMKVKQDSSWEAQSIFN